MMVTNLRGVKQFPFLKISKGRQTLGVAVGSQTPIAAAIGCRSVSVFPALQLPTIPLVNFVLFG